MCDYKLIDVTDARYETLKKGFNLRWPSEGRSADYIYVCDSAKSVHDAANNALAKGYRITIRSGGHCYEGFVSNKLGDETQPLAIIDLGLMTGMEFDEEGNVCSPYDGAVSYRFRAASGNQNWDGYLALYKLANRTIPGGSCYSVGAGGHISGGGYGLLSRLQGLTVDWLSGVDILVPNETGTALIAKHVHLNSSPDDRDLFIACRGAGGGNFGIILNYYYQDLPKAPQQAYLLSLSWPWSSFRDETQLGYFLNQYWAWFNKNDANWNSPDMAKANGGLFTLLKLQHRSTGDIGLLIQYTGTDGYVDGPGQATPLTDFVTHMNSAAGSAAIVTSNDPVFGPIKPTVRSNATQFKFNSRDPLSGARKMDWLHLTQTINGSGANQNGKYKSIYQIGNFLASEVTAIWKFFNDADDPILNQALLQIDSYGGCVNAHDEETSPTSVYQRKSLLKSQLQVYWIEPEHEEHCLKWIRDFYSAYFRDQNYKPYDNNNGRFEGCYINYPDVDMKYQATGSDLIDTRWLELFYGPKRNMLIETKRKVDPHNIFRNEMSIPLSHP